MPRPRLLKRAFDIVVSAVVLLILSPVLLIIALAIKLTAPGPILYAATRAGLHGAKIKVHKFRTMVVNADKIGAGITKSHDPRITSVGRILRRTKLDELPQLFDVLTGTMSLVGPRPEDLRYVALYTPEQRKLLEVRPGITSLASVRFRHEEALLTGPDWEDRYIHSILPAKLAIDLEYLNNVTVWRDIGILSQTVKALFKSETDSGLASAPLPPAVGKPSQSHQKS